MSPMSNSDARKRLEAALADASTKLAEAADQRDARMRAEGAAEVRARVEAVCADMDDFEEGAYWTRHIRAALADTDGTQ